MEIRTSLRARPTAASTSGSSKHYRPRVRVLRTRPLVLPPRAVPYQARRLAPPLRRSWPGRRLTTCADRSFRRTPGRTECRARRVATCPRMGKQVRKYIEVRKEDVASPEANWILLPIKTHARTSNCTTSRSTQTGTAFSCQFSQPVRPRVRHRRVCRTLPPPLHSYLLSCKP